MKVVLFGDSVTEGCFELFRLPDGGVDTIRDIPFAYGSLLEKRLKADMPEKEWSFINSGISGNDTKMALERFDKDVLAHKPDMVIMCFGLNDAWQCNPDAYVANLSTMFGKLQNTEAKTIFMTPNMTNTYVHKNTMQEVISNAKDCARSQNDGMMDLYMKRAKECAEDHGAMVCDCYSTWKDLYRYGVDTTELLCNYINHPTRKMHGLFADALYKKITQEMKF